MVATFSRAPASVGPTGPAARRQPPQDPPQHPARRDRPFTDNTRERSASLNQLLLGSVVLVLALLVVAFGFPGDLSLFLLGVLAVFVITGATIVIPWNRLAPGWLAVVPVLDVIAISTIRQSSPDSGFGLMWIFPAIWLGSAFGLAGLIGGVVAISCALWITIALAPTQSLTYWRLLLPLVIIAVAATSYNTARRRAAQRTLLDKQAVLLGRALERARRQEQAVTEVLDAVDFGVIRLGAEGSIIVTNDSHGELQGAMTGDEGAAQWDAYREDGITPLPAAQMPLARARRGEAFDREIVWFGQPDGPRQALTVTARRLTDSEGADAGAVIVSRDITAELTALRARDDLVASVSHELRTPLTSILGFLDLAIDDVEVPAAARKNLEIAERNAERLLGIVADILAASSASQSTGELTIRPEDVDVSEVVLGAVEALELRAAQRDIDIDTSRVEPSRAWADPLRLRQVLDNLIANAIKYNRDAGTVTLGCATDGDSTWIIVRDTGMGMAGDEMTGLFERFYRARSTRRRGIRGTGLGLSISRDIVRAHGGEVTVQSNPGVGSTFVVRLPAVREAASPAPRLPVRHDEPSPEHDFPLRKGHRP